jgi:hypothetical protein
MRKVLISNKSNNGSRAARNGPAAGRKVLAIYLLTLDTLMAGPPGPAPEGLCYSNYKIFACQSQSAESYLMADCAMGWPGSGLRGSFLSSMAVL